MTTPNITADASFAGGPNEQAAKTKALRMLLYLAIFSMVMFFAGLTSAYVVLMKGEYWVNIRVPQAFYISTIIILVSSLTMHLALRASREGNNARTRTMLVVTLTLGLAFTGAQYFGWQQLIGTGNYVSGSIENLQGTYGEDFTVFFKGRELIMENGKYYFPDDHSRAEALNERVMSKSNTASSFIYALSGLHLAHLAGGLIFLVFLVVKSFLKPIAGASNLGVRQGATYWHFLDILWVYLFLFLLFIH